MYQTSNHKRKLVHASGLDSVPRNSHQTDPDWTVFDSPALQGMPKSKRAKYATLPENLSTALMVPSSAERVRYFARPKSEYRHKPLADGEIRLLQLRDTGFGRKRWTLSSYSLDNIPSYAALSYTWGDPDPLESILIDGQSFFLRENTKCALDNLARDDTVGYLWIDAICIDQSNNAEKSSQVRMMAKIYEQAAEVRVWLGEADSHMRVAVDFISRLLSPGFLSSLHNDWAVEPGFIALAHLLNRSWFSRLWIVQEVSLAKQVLLQFEDRVIQWTDLIDTVQIVQSRLTQIKRSFSTSPNWKDLDVFENFTSSGAASLLQLHGRTILRDGSDRLIGRRRKVEALVCEDTIYAVCSNKRDRIYGVLGLADESASSIQVDYQKSTFEVYADFVRECIRTSQSLDIIGRPWAPMKRRPWRKDFVDPDLIFRIPSWIAVNEDLPFNADPSSDRHRKNADVLVGNVDREVYRASDGIPAVARIGTTLDDGRPDGSLVIRGIELATVTATSTRMADGIILRECLDMIGGMNQPRDCSRKALQIDPRLWRILCANRGENGSCMPATYRMAFYDIFSKLPPSSSIDTVELLQTLDKSEDHVAECFKRLQAVTWNRRVFHALVSRSSDIVTGVGPRTIRSGDKVCILYGGSVPFILREHSEEGETCYELVGACYADGYMEGEAIVKLTKEDLKTREVDFMIW